ncbi:MAG TPA: hypothetical protein DF383_13740 [Deltaproteobacteria bacterium]|nr:hypothetical protein [Deltaproteobacteria bacterium]
MSAFSLLFDAQCRKFKRFSWTRLTALGMILGLLSCGGTAIGPGGPGPGPGSGGGAGGISIDAPTADIEGGTFFEAKVCDTVSGAPEGSFVRIHNASNSQIADLDQVLAADGSFSVQVCVKSGETLELQIFDAAGTSISPTQSITRDVTSPGTCPAPTNTLPNCF